jgi:hypothetical protein
MIVAAIAGAVSAPLSGGEVPAEFASCTGGGFIYFIEADSGGYYAIVGLPSSLRSEYENHTVRIVVSGTYYPSNPSQYPRADSDFHGLIYVTAYVLNGVTSTITNQISPTTMTVGTGLATLTPIRISGLLDYSTEYCAATLVTPSGSNSGAPGLAIPGFTPLSIILGFMMGMAILMIWKTRSKSKQSAQMT